MPTTSLVCSRFFDWLVPCACYCAYNTTPWLVTGGSDNDFDSERRGVKGGRVWKGKGLERGKAEALNKINERVG